ncbi:ornithine cyclodeaminase family protein [Xenorhabdus bovienii]
MIILDRKQIEKIINHYTLDHLFHDVMNGFGKINENLQKNKYQVKSRDGYQYYGEKTGLMEWMPIFNNGENVLIKVVTYHPNNPDKYNIHTILSHNFTIETETGKVLSIIESDVLTAIRTGVVSAYATQYLSRENSSSLGLIGLGTQSVTQLYSILKIREINTVYAYDICQKTISSFKNRVPFFNGEIISSSLERLEENSDIICTATSVLPQNGPVFQGDKLKKHCHINAVGADVVGKIEVPYEIMKKAIVYYDDERQAFHEGECQHLSRDDVVGSIYADDIDLKYRDIITVYDSTGVSYQDLIINEVLIRIYHEMNPTDNKHHIIFQNDAKSPFSNIKI